MIVSSSDFTDDPRYEAFVALDDLLVQSYLDDAEMDCPASVWRNPARRLRAMKLLTAHRLTLASQAGDDAIQPGFVAGALTSFSVSQGSNTASFGDPASTGAAGDELLLLTIYGQEYLKLRRSLMTLGFVA